MPTINAFACGFNNTASGDSSFASGYNTIASGTASHSEGFQTQAINEAAHAEGYYTTAAQHAHSEGERTQAMAIASHAEGMWTLCSNPADAGHAGGYGSRARDYGQRAHSSFQFGTLTSGPPLHGSAQGSDHVLGAVCAGAGATTLLRADGTSAITTAFGSMLLLEVSAVAVATGDITKRGYFKRRFGLFQPTVGVSVLDYDEEISTVLIGSISGWRIDIQEGLSGLCAVRFYGTSGLLDVHVVAHVHVVETTILLQP